EKAWLTRKDKFALDPSLDLYEGEQYAEVLPGIFTDAVPDRWGRTLMERREAILAKREGRSPRTLDEWDFLLGVSDQLRMGALRIANPVDGRFLDDRLPEIPANARLRSLSIWRARPKKTGFLNRMKPNGCASSSHRAAHSAGLARSRIFKKRMEPSGSRSSRLVKTEGMSALGNT